MIWGFSFETTWLRGCRGRRRPPINEIDFHSAFTRFILFGSSFAPIRPLDIVEQEDYLEFLRRVLR